MQVKAGNLRYYYHVAAAHENCGSYPPQIGRQLISEVVSWQPGDFRKEKYPFRSNDSIQPNLVENGEHKNIHFEAIVSST